MVKILSINTNYSIKGGADRFFRELNALLLAQKESVITFTTKSEESVKYHSESSYFTQEYKSTGGPIVKIKNIFRIFNSSIIIKDLEAVLKKEKPQIAHIHNIYHRMPYGIISLLKAHNVKILWWLHDFKWICPNHLLFINNELCERCRDKKYIRALKYTCQNGSPFLSSIVALFAYFTSFMKYADMVDLFIAPSAFVKNKFLEFGFPENKIRNINHFSYFPEINTVESYSDEKKNNFGLYVGRLEKNKGILVMVEAFGQTKHTLKIVGTGNYHEEIQKYCKNRQYSTISFEGYKNPEKLYDYYKDALFTVMPSLWYEVFGLSILESYSYGKPVVASEIGAIPENIEHLKSGILFKPGDVEELKKSINFMFENPQEAQKMGTYAQNVTLKKYSREVYWDKLHKIQENFT